MARVLETDYGNVVCHQLHLRKERAGAGFLPAIAKTGTLSFVFCVLLE